MSKFLPSDRERLGLIGVIGPDAPITLQDVCDRIFGGKISVASLKVEQKRGNLEIFKIGRRYFTTSRAIEDMRARCLLAVPSSAPASRENKTGYPSPADFKSAKMALAFKLDERRKKRRRT